MSSPIAPQTLHQKANTAIDIEHVPVNDDPRQWSRARKVRLSRDALCN
jgi:hypothetical protein